MAYVQQKRLEGNTSVENHAKFVETPTKCDLKCDLVEFLIKLH